MSEPRPRTQHWAPNLDPTSIAIPGVDATASVNDQIDQIDQLITIRLQNIDANFSRIQHLIAAKLLPAFKRYAEGTEPVREAAKFWKSFYEAAAQVRIPIASETSFYQTEDDDSGDQSAVNESARESDTTVTQEDSFVRGAPISSTPLTRDPTTVNLPEDEEDEDSWAASIESPFERLGRQVKDLAQEETREIPEYPSTSSAPSFSPLHGSYTGALPGASSTHHQKPDTRTGSMVRNPLSFSRKGKSPLRQNVLRQNAALAAASDNTSTPPRSLQTPRRNRSPKNPFLPPNSSSRKWNGLVDLRQPSPARSRALRTPGPSSSKGNLTIDGYDSDSSDDLFPPGMSPPVTMQFAMATRARASPVKLIPTPARKAAERIGLDLVASAVDRVSGTAKRLQNPVKAPRGDHSISSVAPSLPSLTRYSGRPTHSQASSFEANIGSAPVQGKFVTPAHQIYRSRVGPQALPTEAGPDRPVSQEAPPQTAPDPRLVEDEAVAPSPGSDSDSSEHDESNPSAGFLFATQNNARAEADDSFASSQQSMSSGEDEDDAARAARHPLAHIFAGGTQGVEDSFDQDESFAPVEEETVFGARQVGQGGEARPKLTLMRDALIDDTDPRAVSLNPFAQVEQSPTPYIREPAKLA